MPAYRYAVELFSAFAKASADEPRENWVSLGQFEVQPDFGPAAEWARLTAVRRGQLSCLAAGELNVEPVWHAKTGAPYVASLRVTVGANGSPPAECGIPATAYFQSAAYAVSGRLVQAGVLRAGERFWFCPVAFPGAPAPPSTAGEAQPFSIEEIEVPLSLKQSSLSQFMQGAVVFGQHWEADFPVFIPQRVLDEMVQATLVAGTTETGGILIGYLHRDPSVSEIFVEVTAQVPLKHARAETAKLGFTAETWTAVRAAIDLRCAEEIWLSWWHSHPVRYFEGEQKLAASALPFFSVDDGVVQRSVFSRAFHTALVVTHSEQGLALSLFGWRDGVIANRGFHILPHARPGQPAPRSRKRLGKGGREHATTNT